MNPLQQAVLAYLQQNAIGGANAKNSDTIYNAIVHQGLPVIAGRAKEHARTSVISMINDHSQLRSESGFNSPNGYYIIQNKDEAIATIMSLVSRSKSMLDRVGALRNEWNNQNPGNTI